MMYDDLDVFYTELKKYHTNLCPECSFADIWRILNNEFQKVTFKEINNDRMMLLLKIAMFDYSTDYSDERWKTINGYENYEISDKGRIRRKNGKFMHYDVGSFGHKRVNLSKDGRAKKNLVHRLVAEAFIPNPKGLPIINHKDEQPWNNQIDNLEWCTYEYNNSYNGLTKRRFETRSENIKSGKTKLGNPIVQLSIDGNFVKEWTNAQQAYKALGIDASTILSCCKHNPRNKSAGGYKWVYKKEWENRGEN